MADIGRLEFMVEGMGAGGPFPLDYTGRGANISPGFRLKNLLPEACSLAVTLEDLSHPIQNFTHWVIWNLPAEETIPAGIPAGRTVLKDAVQGMAYGFHRYAGPKPPRGSRHEYRFTVYALDRLLNVGPGAGKRSFLRAAEGHILQMGTLSGFFE